MRDGVPPVGLGHSFLHDRRVDLDFAMDQTLTPPSFATYTSTSTSSVASPSLVLPQHPETLHTRRDSLNNNVSVPSSARSVSTSSAVDAALVAGSVSVLIGIGCILGFICYKRKRHEKGDADLLPKSRNIRISWKAHDDGHDVEASARPLVHISDTVSNKDSTSGAVCDSQIKRFSTSAQFGSNHSSLSQLSTAKTVTSFTTPLVMYANQRPPESPTLSLTSTLCSPSLEMLNDTLSSCIFAQSESKRPSICGMVLEELEEDDLGSVVLSSLQINETLTTVESYDIHFATSRSVLPITKHSTSEHGVFLDNGCSLTTSSTSEDGLCDDVVFSETPSTPHSSLTLSFDSQSLVTQDSPTLRSMQSLPIPDSPTLSTMHPSPQSILPLVRYGSDLAFLPGSAGYTEMPLRLLELKLDSEVDLRSCLGIDREDAGLTAISKCRARNSDSSEIPDLVTTDSQETVTGTDESYDHNAVEVPSICSFGYQSQQEYESQCKPITPDGDLYSMELRMPVFDHGLSRSYFLHPIAASSQAATSSIVPDNQTQARTLSPSPSYASSTSVTTLQLPKYCASGQSPLIEEVLPPPSIIVSVPTDGSLILDSYGSAQFSVMRLTTGTEEQRVRNNRTKGCSGDVAKVVYDPIDEVEENAWGDAYERTCFVEASGSYSALGIAESSHGFAANWMSSSESSELDIQKTIAKFPLPPIPYIT